MNYDYLIIAGSLSFLAALMHIGIIIGGPNWYRFFGAGESMARMAETGSLKPTFITLGIALVLTIWGIYAWSGAGLIPRAPFLKSILTTITAVYFARGMFGFIAPFSLNNPQIQQNTIQFWIWSSLICLTIGSIHLFGLVQNWTLI